MPTITERIQSKAIEILRNNPQGIKYSTLVRDIKAQCPEFEFATIRGTVWNLHNTRSKEVYKAARGLFRHVSFQGTPVESEATIRKTSSINEESFYQPFADYLWHEREECTKAIPLGGRVFGDKWGTPDVIGIDKSLETDLVKHDTIISSAEIKTDTSGSSLITAFGQACAYRSFSHFTYLVIPKTANEDDRNRLESLSTIFGIGLIYFDSTNPQNPQWEIRVTPLRHEPDMFYVNLYMKIIEKSLFV